MALVKLEIDGRRVMAEGSQTILQVARQHGIQTIPTLCDDPQLEPFASCFVCVVKVKGARSLMPACSTKVLNGMVVETNSPEVRQSRKAALELLLSDHYADCVGPCQISCPAGIDIQGYIALAAIGKYKDAIALIKDSNPLPSVCGRVCTRPCEVKGCRRTLLDEAVGIDYIKRYISDLDLNSPDVFRPQTAAPNGRKVAVVGAGPAGLSAAYYLAIRGYDVEIFEGQPDPGGMLRYGIPEYRLPKDVLDLEIAQILTLGPKLHTNVALGKDFTIAGLKEQGFDAVFLGIGAWRSSLMRVQNENAPGVLSGIEFLKNFGLRKKIDIHGTVAVVGGGNTAIDCARTALRLGVKEVRLLYRRTRNEMPANDSEIKDAIEEGVNMQFLIAPTRVVTGEDGTLQGLECQRCELGEPDASGRRSPKPIKGSEYLERCDFIISAIGQSTTVSDLVDGRVPDFLPRGESLNLTRWQTVQVNEKTFETTVDGVFSGGDVVTGAATAIEAIAAGRKAAHAIDTYIREGTARPEPEEFLSRKDTFAKVGVKDLRGRETKARRHIPMIPVDQRVKSFVEVELGYTDADLGEETTRCLECGCVALFDCDLRKYATEYGVGREALPRRGAAARAGHLAPAHRAGREQVHPLRPLRAHLQRRRRRVRVRVHQPRLQHRGGARARRVAPGDRLRVVRVVHRHLPDRRHRAAPAARQARSVEDRNRRERLPLLRRRLPHRLRRLRRHAREGVPQCRERGDVRQPLPERPLRLQLRPRQGPVDHRKGPDRRRRGRRPGGGRGRPRGGAPQDPVPEIRAGRDGRVRLAAAHERGDLPRAEVRAGRPPDAQRHVVQPPGEPRDVRPRRPRDGDLPRARVGAGDSRGQLGARRRALRRRPDRQAGDPPRSPGYLHRPVRQPHRGRRRPLPPVPARRRDAGRSGHRRRGGAARRAGARARTRGRRRGALRRRRWPSGPAWTPDAIAEAAKALAGAARKVLVFNRDYRGVRREGDVRWLAAAGAALGCGVLPLHEKSNAQGLLDMGAYPAWFPGYRPVSDPAAIEDLEKDWSVSLRDLDTAPVDIAAPARPQGDQGGDRPRRGPARERGAPARNSARAWRPPSSSSWPTCSPRRRPPPRTSSCRQPAPPRPRGR